MIRSREHTTRNHPRLFRVNALLTLATMLAAPVFAQIMTDPPSNATGATSSLSWSHAVGSGSDRLLIVGISIRHANRTVNSVTYAGISLSRMGFQNSANNTCRLELWSLRAPPSGPADITVDISGSADIAAGAASYSGVDQTSPLGGFSSANGTGPYGSLSVSGALDELVMDVVVAPGIGLSLAPDGAQETIWNAGTGTAGNNVWGASSSKSGGPSVTMGWSIGAPADWAIGAVTIRPVPTPNIVLSMSQDISNPPPGATITYTIDYVNNGAGQANSASIAFSPPSNTTLVANSVTLNGVAKTDAADGDEVTLVGTTITVNLGTVPSGSGGTTNYKVVVQ